MNCQIFETVVNDLARDQMMEANVREHALAHSEGCETCALKLTLERRLTSDLRELSEEMKPLSAPPRVEQELLTAFRSQSSFVSETQSLSRRRYWAVAAAAVVLVGLGLSGLWWQFDRPSSPIASKPTEIKTPVPVAPIQNRETQSTPEVKPAVYLTRRKKPLKRLRNTPSKLNETLVAREMNASEDGNSDPREVTTEFLPLSYVNPTSLQDGGQLVRVELPRDAMVRFGLPVNMERYGEKVKADVLVSADGLARAIRFVQ